MSMIEGVGDEVLVVVGLFTLLCIVLLAWFSTHTRDIPFVSVIVVELSQRRQRNANNGNSGVQNREEGLDGNLTDTAAGAGGPSGDAAGSNNNADPATDSAEDNASPTASKSRKVVGGMLQSLPDSETKSTDSQLPVASESEGQDLPEQAAEGSGPVQAEAEVMTIPPFRPQHESGEEVRQRRVAYFSGGSGQGSFVARKDSSSSGMLAADELTVGDKAEVTASCPVSGHQPDSSFPTPSSGTLADGQSSPPICPVGASSSTAQCSEPPASCSPDLPLWQSDSSPSSPRTSLSQASVSEGSPSSLADIGGALPGVSGGSSSRIAGEPPAGGTGSAEGFEEGASASEGVRERTQDYSSDATDTASQQIRVRLKYLNDTQRLVYANPQETVGNFRRLHFSSELEDNKIIRFIFNGQDLRNDLSTLRACNIIDNSVVHCLITQNRQSESQAHAGGGAGQEEDTQMGTLLFPVFGVILGLVWYLRFTYKQYFNAMSTVSLAGISFIYLLAFFSTLQHRRRLHPHLE